jgi:hypothetical protein
VRWYPAGAAVEPPTGTIPPRLLQPSPAASLQKLRMTHGIRVPGMRSHSRRKSSAAMITYLQLFRNHAVDCDAHRPDDRGVTIFRHDLATGQPQTRNRPCFPFWRLKLPTLEFGPRRSLLERLLYNQLPCLIAGALHHRSDVRLAVMFGAVERRCLHGLPVALVPLIVRWAANASSDKLRHSRGRPRFVRAPNVAHVSADPHKRVP